MGAHLVRARVETTRNAIRYFVENWQAYAEHDIGFLAMGILGLTELNFFYYEDLIKEIAEYIVSTQHQSGYFGKIPEHDTFLYYDPDNMLLVICALSRVIEPESSNLQKALNWCVTL
jgi:hypothetical protein